MDLIDRAIGQFLKRLASVIAEIGGHVEQHFG